LLESNEHGKKLKKVIKEYVDKMNLNIQNEEEQEILNLELKNEHIQNENTTQQINILNNIEERIILDFEIFCVKWERYLIVDKQLLEINEMYNLICNSIKDVKIHKVGSFNSCSLRSNYLYIDLVVEHQNTRVKIIEECVKILEGIPKIKSDYLININNYSSVNQEVKVFTYNITN
jgi:hypothetical protein